MTDLERNLKGNQLIEVAINEWGETNLLVAHKTRHCMDHEY